MEYRATAHAGLRLTDLLPGGLLKNHDKNLIVPLAANENLPVKSEWMTPAEALQVITRIKNRLLEENRQTQSLFHSANRRRTWDEVKACEDCLRWMYFRNC